MFTRSPTSASLAALRPHLAATSKLLASALVLASLHAAAQPAVPPPAPISQTSSTKGTPSQSKVARPFAQDAGMESGIRRKQPGKTPKTAPVDGPKADGKARPAQGTGARPFAQDAGMESGIRRKQPRKGTASFQDGDDIIIRKQPGNGGK